MEWNETSSVGGVITLYIPLTAWVLWTA